MLLITVIHSFLFRYRLLITIIDFYERLSWYARGPRASRWPLPELTDNRSARRVTPISSAKNARCRYAKRALSGADPQQRSADIWNACALARVLRVSTRYRLPTILAGDVVAKF